MLSIVLAAMAWAVVAPLAQARAAGATISVQDSQSSGSPASKPLATPHGKKLVLTDGSFQLAREYKVEGERVRYFSVDTRQWEEMPAALVDWEATRKLEAEEAKRNAAEVAKVHARDKASQVPELDIDASLEAAPGVFLPPEPGVFVYDMKTVTRLEPADTDVKSSKGQTFKQILVPIPIVASRRTITIRGTRAKVRVKAGQAEFYIRTPNAHEPEIQLIPTKVKGYAREIQQIDTRFKEDTMRVKTVNMQQWTVARGVYRFTLGENLPPGEYAIAEVVRDEGISIYVWDFGVDAGAGVAGKTK
jgi:hypothetical protein